MATILIAEDDKQIREALDRILRFEGSAADAGAEITKDGEQVGVLSSAARGVGLALLRRGVEPGEMVTVGEGRALVEAVPED